MKKFLVIALAIGTIVGCKKKDDGPAQLEVTAANIAGVYKLTAEVEVISGVTYDRFNGGTIAGVAYRSDYETCEKDDTYTFTTTNVTIAEGATSCTPPTSSVTLPYTFSTSAKTVTLDGQTATVKSLTANTMVAETSTTTSGVTIVSTSTYSK